MDHLFISAVGSFKPHIAEISKSIYLEFAKNGRIVCVTEEAAHEAGDLLLAGLQPSDYLTLKEIVNRPESLRDRRSILFKSCGSALRDLAAARVASK